MKVSVIFLVILVCNFGNVFGWRKFLRGKSKDGIGAPNLSQEHELPKALWFQQNLDHFDPTNMQRWHQVIYFILIIYSFFF